MNNYYAVLKIKKSSKKWLIEQINNCNKDYGSELEIVEENPFVVFLGNKRNLTEGALYFLYIVGEDLDYIDID